MIAFLELWCVCVCVFVCVFVCACAHVHAYFAINITVYVFDCSWLSSCSSSYNMTLAEYPQLPPNASTVESKINKTRLQANQNALGVLLSHREIYPFLTNAATASCTFCCTETRTVMQIVHWCMRNIHDIFLLNPIISKFGVMLENTLLDDEISKFVTLNDNSMSLSATVGVKTDQIDF